MRNRVKISIIMSVYNPEKKKIFLQPVRSVIAQSFKEWELLLYDDGSGKESADFIRKAAAMDERIVYLRGSRNLGLAAALNICISYAAGKYVARMDADDIAKKERLQIQYRFLESHPQYQWVGSNVELIDEYGVWGLQRMPRIPGKWDFLLYSPFVHPSVMFRKETLIKVNGYCTSRGLLLCEDYQLFMKLYRNHYRGYNIQKPLLQYRETYNSYKKRRLLRRLREVRLKYHGFRKLGILKQRTFFYVLRPLAAGVIPVPVHYYLRRVWNNPGEKRKDYRWKENGKRQRTKKEVSEIFSSEALPVPGRKTGREK